MVAAAGPRTGAAAIPQPVLSAMSIVLAAYVRRATLADVAAIARLSVPAGLRTWASGGSVASAFLLAAGMAPMQQRWRVGRGGVAVPGVVYGWAAKSKEPRGRPAAALRSSPSAATS